jgi:hypothetical protein
MLEIGDNVIHSVVVPKLLHVVVDIFMNTIKCPCPASPQGHFIDISIKSQAFYPLFSLSIHSVSRILSIFVISPVDNLWITCG